jgi:ABC-type branched-subunit amino acid transport system ATPase component/branched-subunit amino acid ABC-type transport system permease component
VTDVLRFAILGLGAGALYAIAAVGLVLVYRGSGVVNFAQGAMGMVAAYVFYEARQKDHLPALIAVALGLLASAVLGAAFHLLILRRMTNSSMLAKIVATLALLVVLQDVTLLRFGAVPQIVTSMLPTAPVRIIGVEIGQDRLYIFGIVVALTAVLWAVYKFTLFGVATTAVAENPTAAASLGVSPHVIASVNWALGAALGGLAAILLVPITSLSSDLLSLIVIPILAAAVVGRFSSFPVTMLAGLAIGIAQSEVTRWVNGPGWATAVPFAFVAVSLVRGHAIAGRGESFGRMPSLGSGRISVGLVFLAGAASLLCIWVLFPSAWLAAAQLQLIIVIVLISFAVVTGFGGQVSLMQMGFAGIAAVVAARLYNFEGWSLEMALLVGVAATIPVGLVVGLAGVRTRGVQLAIVTMGLAYSLDAVVFGNPAYTGGLGFVARTPRLFGLDVDPMKFPMRYATATLIVVVLVGLAVANLRRGRAGRRLIAVRTNERAAMALGVSVVGAKLYAFVLGGMIAGLGGILLTFDPLLISSGNLFGGFESVSLMQLAVFGGVGHLGGPLIVSGLQGGTLGQQVFSFLGGRAGFYLSLAGAIGLLLMLPTASNGLAPLIESASAPALAALRRRLPSRSRPSPLEGSRPDRAAAPPKTLRVENLRVRFGGTVALADLTVEVGPGEIVGLIGPNGSGKTTAIESITGFVTPAAGTVTLGGTRINHWSPERRARAGLSRSFQSLELFDDLTVSENLQAACDPRDIHSYLSDLFHPGRGKLTAEARAALGDFGLEDHLGTQARHLGYAQRRLLAVARAVAGGGSILLLDEPASGLSETETASLSASIRRLAETSGVGVLLIEHNVDMVLRTCHRVIALDFGVVIGEGPPDVIRANPAVVAAYLGTARYREEFVDESVGAGSLDGLGSAEASSEDAR